jgi:hypothetical protein
MSSLMMALARRNMQERLTKHHNKVIILMHLLVFYEDVYIYIYKGNAIPLQALTGPEGSRRLRLPDLKTIMYVCV